MRKIVIGIFLGFLLIELTLQGVSLWNRREFIFPKSFDPNSIRILVVGESTSHGVMLQDKNDSYPAVLRDLLRESLKRPVHVYNYSIPGNTSHHIKEKINDYLKASKPDLVICHFGNNDFNPILNPYFALDESRSFPNILANIKIFKFLMLLKEELRYKSETVELSPDGERVFFKSNKQEGKDEKFSRVSQQLYENYAYVISKVRKNSSKVIMLSYFQTFENTNTTLKNLSEKLNVPLISLHKESIAKSLLSSDLWHPSVEGHQFIAKIVFEKSQELLGNQNK